MKLPTKIVDDMYEAASRFRKDAGVRSYLGMSGIGGQCSRKIWYGFRGYTPTALEGRAQMIFSLGDRVEEEVIKWLRAAGFTVTGMQDAFEALNGLFRGHCDGIIEGPKVSRRILEVKSASASRFKAFQEGGVQAVSPEYYAQVQCYMGYSGLPKAQFVIMNKNDCSLYTERIHFSKMDFAAIEAKAAEIIGLNCEPPKAFDEDSIECRRCDYRMHCWHGPYVQEKPTCGTCPDCEFTGVQPRCLKHQRDINKWGFSCPDWRFRDTVMDEVPF